jgi:hypothetical protein
MNDGANSPAVACPTTLDTEDTLEAVASFPLKSPGERALDDSASDFCCSSDSVNDTARKEEDTTFMNEYCMVWRGCREPKNGSADRSFDGKGYLQSLC